MLHYSLELEITYACNLRCRHCYLRDELNSYTHMSRRVFTDIVHDFTEHIRGQVIVSGGEPTLHPEFSEFMRFLRDNNVHACVLTNGTNPERIVENYYDGLFVQVSVDGDEEAHDWLRGRGVYRRVVRALELFEEHGIPVVLKCTLHKKNIRCINHVLALKSRFRNIRAVSFNFYVPVGSPEVEPVSREEFFRLKKLLHVLGLFYGEPYMYGKCYAGELHVSVTPDGTYIDCPQSRRVLGRYPEPVYKLYSFNPKGKTPPCLKIYYGEG